YARAVLDITDDDRVFSVAPISHAYGLGASITFPLGAGAVSIVDPAFPMPPPRIAELAATEQPSLFFAAPGAYAALAAADIRGDGIATGYWCQAALSRETFQGEWVHTGDMYSRSPEGRYTYLGRSNDMFKASGEWVSPAEVEAALTEHPGVLEAAVVPEPDDA